MPRRCLAIGLGLFKTVWPSGLRRWLKAPFRKGVGSNPTAVIADAAIARVAATAQELAAPCPEEGAHRSQIGLRWRNSPMCTLSQNGYGAA